MNKLGPSFGHKVSKEARKKISAFFKGKRTGKLNPFFGKTHSDKAKEILREKSLGRIPWNKGVKGYKLGKRPYAKTPKGENHPNWIKDRTLLKKAEDRRSSANNNWRRCVLIRDDGKCKIVNSSCNGRLEVHHILNWKEYPELRYEINNGITLCHAHHPRGRKKEMQLSPYLQDLIRSAR